RLKTQASRQALERAYLEIKAVYGDSANKSRGKGEPGHGKSSSLTKICPKCGKKYPFLEKYCSACGTKLVEENELGSYRKTEEQRKQYEAEQQRRAEEERRRPEEKSGNGIKTLFVVVIIAVFGLFGYKAFSPDKNYSVGDIIKFGSYQYYENGGEKAIEWQILEKYKDGTALVISKYALDNVKYNETDTDVTWETSTIRKWLNNDFYNKAFRNADKNLIVQSYLENKNNSDYRTKGGNNTRDKMFLLSIDEAKKYFSVDKERRLYPTPYTKGSNSKNGKLWTKAEYGGSCWWWLRSPGDDQDHAAYVDDGGGVDSCGDNVNNDNGAVRVALKINLKNL
ncbi:MAG: hypothetical protein J5706_07935, partial [Elusimicrobiales bacterium]|nr:hypothetical protein [Elusimicrobiales bacterium]